jgi:hypothetical protein
MYSTSRSASGAPSTSVRTSTGSDARPRHNTFGRCALQAVRDPSSDAPALGSGSVLAGGGRLVRWRSAENATPQGPLRFLVNAIRDPSGDHTASHASGINRLAPRSVSEAIQTEQGVGAAGSRLLKAMAVPSRRHAGFAP